MWLRVIIIPALFTACLHATKLPSVDKPGGERLDSSNPGLMGMSKSMSTQIRQRHRNDHLQPRQQSEVHNPYGDLSLGSLDSRQNSHIANSQPSRSQILQLHEQLLPGPAPGGQPDHVQHSRSAPLTKQSLSKRDEASSNPTLPYVPNSDGSITDTRLNQETQNTVSYGAIAGIAGGVALTVGAAVTAISVKAHRMHLLQQLQQAERGQRATEMQPVRRPSSTRPILIESPDGEFSMGVRQLHHQRSGETHHQASRQGSGSGDSHHSLSRHGSDMGVVHIMLADMAVTWAVVHIMLADKAVA